MPRPHPRRIATPLLAALVAAAGSGMAHRAAAQAVPQAAATPSASNIAALAKARADSARHLFTEADVRFMTGMISHHAQAILMAGWAPTHGASPSVRTLCERIINAQRDEIVTMQQWLRDRGQPVPEPSPHGMKMTMNGAEHTMLMPGMLTDAQLAQLDSARGPEFDRLFLTFMIQHHRGAIAMVKDLFDTYGAAQDELAFKLASDINADQTTEIARMQRMLIALTLANDSL
ncbi:MAG: DUF305 domain-containing protein [Gemmatimonadaceae bacterium]|nr:DUF305 domain-containing protein [Gemmatimonadaceae bacterium]